MSIDIPKFSEPIRPQDLNSSELSALDDVVRIVDQYYSGDTVTAGSAPIELPDGVDSKYADTSNLGLVLSDTPQAHAETDAQRKYNEALAAKVGSSSLQFLQGVLTAPTLQRDEAASHDAPLSAE